MLKATRKLLERWGRIRSGAAPFMSGSMQATIEADTIMRRLALAVARQPKDDVVERAVALLEHGLPPWLSKIIEVTMEAPAEERAERFQRAMAAFVDAARGPLITTPKGE